MPIFQTAHYQVRPAAVEKVKAAIAEFAGEAAHQAHGRSEAVRRFEAVYTSELVDGPVVFTDYLQVAYNRDR